MNELQFKNYIYIYIYIYINVIYIGIHTCYIKCSCGSQTPDLVVEWQECLLAVRPTCRLYLQTAVLIERVYRGIVHNCILYVMQHM